MTDHLPPTQLPESTTDLREPWADAYFGAYFPSITDDPTITDDLPTPTPPHHRHILLLVRIITLLTIIAASLLCICLTSCATVPAGSPAGKHPSPTFPDTLRATAHTTSTTHATTDTLILRDSIYIRERIAGDTVRIESTRYLTRYLAHTIITHDTILLRDTLTILQPPIQVPVHTDCQRAHVTKFSRLLSTIGLLTILTLLIIAIYRLSIAKVNPIVTFASILTKINNKWHR